MGNNNFKVSKKITNLKNSDNILESNFWRKNLLN